MPQGTPSALPSLETAAFELQVRLALLAYGHTHPETHVTLDQPMKNEKAVRDEAMRDWLSGENPFSTRFREYLSTHAKETIDMSRAEVLEALLGELEATETRH